MLPMVILQYCSLKTTDLKMVSTYMLQCVMPFNLNGFIKNVLVFVYIILYHILSDAF